MDVPSSSNVTGRRKRTVNRDSDDESFGGTPIRRVRGTKRAEPQSVAPETVMQEVNAKVDEIVNRRKIGATNCFDFKSPLEMYGIEKMIEANASIQEMAVVLESAQMVVGYRVDRLHHDVRNVDAAISGRDMTRVTGEEAIAITIENRKAKKKMAVSDGVNTVTAFLQDIDDGDITDLLTRVRQDVAALELPEGRFGEDDANAGDDPVDITANSKDVDLFMQREVCLDGLIKSLSEERAEQFRQSLVKNASPFVSPDDAAHDLKDCEIDWLKSNATFQKATKGSVDNTATSFHSLNHFGTHSPSGRMLVLHPRIRDKHEDDRFYLSDCTVSLANNMRCLLGNALEKKPAVLDNYLMLEARDRPVIGKYKIMSKEVKKSTLPLAEAARERDLANLTFAEMTRANSIADTTIAGSSDISMLPGHQALPLAEVEVDETLAGENPELNTTISTRSKAGKDEYQLPSIDALALEESLIGRLPMDPLDMGEMLKMYDKKLEDYNESDALESKLWKNGLRAEEWGDDDEAEIKKSTRSCISSGIEGWMKAVDVWTNYDPVKLHMTRETVIPHDEEGDPNKIVHPGLGTHVFLVKSDDYMNSYPGDRTQEFKMVGEELDVMKMIPGDEGVEDTRPLEEIQREIRQMNEEPEYEEIDDDYEAPPVGVEFNDTLVAPADTDDFVEPVNHDDDNRHDDFIFNTIDEPQEEIRDERAIQRDIENIALGANEVAELMSARPEPDLVGPSVEQREEIRNIGKSDNAHWIPPEIADNERAAVLAAQRKKKEKKSKIKKVTVEEYTSYFRDFTDIEERQRESTDKRCLKMVDEKTYFLPENHIYLATLGTENKPHIAVDLTVLTTSSLFFKTDSDIPPSIKNQVKQKSFGKLRLERTKKEEDEADALFAEDTKGNREADCLSWLLTFSGFKCMENPVSVSEADKTAPVPFERQEEEVREIYFDDEYDRYNPRQEQRAAFYAMGEANQKKLAHFSSHLFGIQNEFRAQRERGFDDSDDDEFEDSFDHQSIQAKNLDAAKHKKCLADILNNQTLSMPCIQYALEQLTLNQQSRKNNSTLGPNTSMRDATMHSPGPYDPDATLKTVFDYNSPAEESDVKKILDALTDITTYGEAEAVAPNPNNGQPSSSQYGTANTENRKVKINGFHTLLSLALSMPPKMGESVKPSSIVSFILHVANENSLKIVQDRSKKAWMTDFVVLNQADNLPSGLKMGSIDELGEFWMRTQDPDAIEGSAADQAPLFTSIIRRPRVTAVRRGTRGAGPSARVASPVENLGAIAEEEEMEE